MMPRTLVRPSFLRIKQLALRLILPVRLSSALYLLTQSTAIRLALFLQHSRVADFLGGRNDQRTLHDPIDFVKQTLDRWRAALPFHYDLLEQTLLNYVEMKCGRRDPEFLFEVERHSVHHLVVLYDMVANEDERMALRKWFRQLMRGRRFFEIRAPLRTRLREHKMFVMCGLDPPDPDERRRGRAP
jgi:hypothetical protein